MMRKAFKIQLSRNIPVHANAFSGVEEPVGIRYDCIECKQSAYHKDILNLLVAGVTLKVFLFLL